MPILQTLIASITADSGSGGGSTTTTTSTTTSPPFKSWTIEWWEKKLSPQTNTVPRVFSCGVDTSASIGYSNEQGGDYVWTAYGTTGPFTVGSIANSWHHFSINSDGVNLYVFEDGVQKAVAARIGDPITDASTSFILGGDTIHHWKGRITDFHIMKNGCKYINPGYYPNARLTPESNSVLLLPFASLNSFAPSRGPLATTVSATWVADDPWGDSGGSVEFNGTTGSFMSWNGSSIFALDV